MYGRPGKVLTSFRISLLGILASIFIRLLRLTWQVKIQGPIPSAANPPVIYCFWHGKQAGLLAYPNPRQTSVLSSLSRDGTLQARILSSLGFVVHRGSSSKGGAEGLKAIIGELLAGKDAGFAVDGPRGPIYHAKPGAIEAAKQSKGILAPITTLASSSWIFNKAWDHYMLPKPFATVTIIRGPHLNPNTSTTYALTQAINELDPSHTPNK